MKQLNKTQTIIYLLGATLMTIGAGISLLAWSWAPYIYSVGALGFASMQMLQRYEGSNFTIRRLRRIMLLSDVLFLVYSLQDWWRAQGSSDKNMKSTYLSKDVANWFKDQIAKHPNTKYRVTLSHKNIFSGAGHHTDDECPLIRDIMIPILKECEIDLAIQGHDHCYEVMGPVDPDTWTVVPGSVTDTTRIAPEATGRWERSENKTGLEGGTFKTDEGTLYFIGATCGRKRYEPHNRALMEEEYTTDPNTKFGQPGAPSYSRFNVTAQGIEVITYKTDAAGNKTVYNTIHVKRDTPHSVPLGYENAQVEQPVRNGEKFIRNGQLYIMKDGVTYNILGISVK